MHRGAVTMVTMVTGTSQFFTSTLYKDSSTQIVAACVP